MNCVPVREVLDAYIGGGWGQDSQSAEFSEPAWVIRGADFPPVRTGRLREVPYRYHKPSNLRSRRLAVGDIIFEVSGGTKGRPVGRSLLVTRRLAASLGGDAMCASFCKKLRPSPAAVDSAYLFWALQYLYRTGVIEQYQVQSTGISNFNFEGFIDDEVLPLPAMTCQRRIAAVMSHYDSLIEVNTRRIQILEEMARRVYREWFVEFRYPGHQGVPLVESQIGAVPDGWDVGTLLDLLVLQRGYDLPKKSRKPGPVPVVAATGIHGTHSNRAACGPGVVTGRSGSLGTVMYVHDDFWPLNTTLWVKEFRRATPELAYFLLDSLDLASYNSGAAVPTLNRNDISGLGLPVPPESLVARFSIITIDAFDLMRTLRSSNETLRTTRDFLIPRLVSGEVDVSELDIDTSELVA